MNEEVKPIDAATSTMSADEGNHKYIRMVEENGDNDYQKTNLRIRVSDFKEYNNAIRNMEKADIGNLIYYEVFNMPLGLPSDWMKYMADYAFATYVHLLANATETGSGKIN